MVDGASLAAIAAGEVEVPPLSVADLPRVRSALWAKYVAELKAAREPTEMRYTVERKGEPPYPLFIALHGGGQAPAEVNDAQWEQMQAYYADSVEHGIYVAPRGITNDWNLHFRPESYALYDQLIREMIALEEVDPNKVYLLGYSAGGDGVYQVAARLPDRFAAANMSAGHPNSVPLHNLLNLPMLLQVGELDAAYDRNRVTAQTCLALRDLDSPHACFIHQGRGHNFVDRDPSGAPQPVFADVAGWLDGTSDAVKEVDANAVHWVRGHVRDPLPTTVRLDPSTAPPESDPVRAYWVEAPAASGTLVARYDRATNRVTVDGPARLWVSEAMLDLNAPIEVVVGDGAPRSIEPELRAKTLARSLLERGDPNFAFPALLEVTNTSLVELPL